MIQCSAVLVFPISVIELKQTWKIVPIKNWSTYGVLATRFVYIWIKSLKKARKLLKGLRYRHLKKTGTRWDLDKPRTIKIKSKIFLFSIAWQNKLSQLYPKYIQLSWDCLKDWNLVLCSTRSCFWFRERFLDHSQYK